MKKILLILLVTTLNMTVYAQGNSGNKGKDKDKEKNKTNTPGNSKGKDKEDKTGNDHHDSKVWDGIADQKGSCMKPSKNQPAKVRSSFQRDYPNAMNVRWTKCRGNWTASFNYGVSRSTAVYHANGDRRDTRTWTPRENMPPRILDEILKRRPGTSIDGAIKIEQPNMVRDIFRIKNMIEGKPQYIYLDADGSQVTYDY